MPATTSTRPRAATIAQLQAALTELVDGGVSPDTCIIMMTDPEGNDQHPLSIQEATPEDRALYGWKYTDFGTELWDPDTEDFANGDRAGVIQVVVLCPGYGRITKPEEK